MALALKVVFACACRTNMFGFSCVVASVDVFIVNSSVVGVVVSDNVVVDEGVSVAVDVSVFVVTGSSVRKIASNKPNLAVAVLVVDVNVFVEAVVNEVRVDASNPASRFFLLLFLGPGIPV